MTNFRRYFILITMLAVFLVFIIRVNADNTGQTKYEQHARFLFNIGLYKGIDKVKFVPDLDSTLDRQAAIVMVIRLLGLEKDALQFSMDESKAILEKFDDSVDIGDWAKKQVAYAQYKNIIKGFEGAENKVFFRPKENVTDKQYCTMILKALGYEGFDFGGAPKYLKDIGGLDEESVIKYSNGNILTKDNLINISYQALKSRYTGNQGKTVLETLVDANYVDVENIAKQGYPIVAKPNNAIIPAPLDYISRTGNFKLDIGTAISVCGNTPDETMEILKIGNYLARKLRPATGFDLYVVESENPSPGSIFITTKNGRASLGNEGYTLNVLPDMIVLEAANPEGLFRGIQSIRQLLPPNIEKNNLVSDVAWNIPCSYIIDKPSCSWRGYMLDVARHFFSVDDVKRSIDLMAQYKMNKFRLHLSDDQGWRIEIKSWPNLTTIGSKTQVGGGYGGFYTQEQFVDIVNFAKERYIEIIPELDMPGHTNAALASYGNLNPDGKRKDSYTGTTVGFSSLMCRNEITYNFVDNVIQEIADISPSQYIHIGGDEAWSTANDDYTYFIGRVADIVAKKGKKMIAWNDTYKPDGVHKDSLIQYWRGSIDAVVSKGIKIIASPSDRAYLDMKYNNDNPIGLIWAGITPTDDAYTWDPTDKIPSENIAGVECPLWTETVVTRDNIDYLTYPRLLCISEIGWTPQNMRNWNEYKYRLKVHGLRMKNQGIAFYADPIVSW